MAKYPYIVNKNGTWYPSGAEVPEDANFVLDGKCVGTIDGDVVEITDEALINANQYTKTQINRMPLSELRDLAKLNHIPNSEKMSGTDLKKALIKAFML